MKRISALSAMIFFLSFHAQSQSLTRIEHTFRNGSAAEVAEMLSNDFPEKSKVGTVNDLFHLLQQPKSSTKIKNIDSHDLAVFMLSRITEIPLSHKDETSVTAIISCLKKDGRVYRYHLVKLSDKEREEFTKKVKLWIIQKSHA